MSEEIRVLPSNLREASRGHADVEEHLRSVTSNNADILESVRSLGPVFKDFADDLAAKLDERHVCYTDQADEHADLSVGLDRASTKWQEHESVAARGISDSVAHTSSLDESHGIGTASAPAHPQPTPPPNPVISGPEQLSPEDRQRRIDQLSPDELFPKPWGPPMGAGVSTQANIQPGGEDSPIGPNGIGRITDIQGGMHEQGMAPLPGDGPAQTRPAQS